MKVEVLKERDDFIEISVKGEDQSIFDALSEVLQSMEGVEYAGHRLLHPLAGEVRMIVKTKAGVLRARDALMSGLEKLGRSTEELLSIVEKI